MRLVPINTHHVKTTLFNCSSSSEPWQPEWRQNIITALTTLPQGWVLARSISAQQQSLQSGQNLRGPFLRATLPMTVGSCAQAIADNQLQAIVKSLNAVFEGVPKSSLFLHSHEGYLLLPETIREEIIREIFGTQQGTSWGFLMHWVQQIDYQASKTKWDELEHSVHPQWERQSDLHPHFQHKECNDNWWQRTQFI